MLTGKQYLLAIILMAAVLLPLSFLAESIHLNSDITTVDRSTLRQELSQTATPLFVEVLSRDCNSQECAENDKVVSELASEYRGKVKFLRVFVEDVPEAPQLLGVHSTPSGVLVEPHGDVGALEETAKIRATVEGFGNRSTLKQLLSRLP